MTRRQCSTRKGGKGNVCRKSPTHVGRIFTPNGLVRFEKIGCQGCVVAWAKGHESTAYQTTIQTIAEAAPLVAAVTADGTKGYKPSTTFPKVTT